MRVLFLNQYFPPDPAPTGILLKEIADALVVAGHEVVFASSGQDYRAGQKKGSRMKRELAGLQALFLQAMRSGPVDAVVSATSPPLLVVMGGVIAKLKRAPHYHWLFDMYPELATALGEIKDGPLAGVFRWMTRWAYRRAECVVALDADMAERVAGYGVGADTIRVIAPWVLQAMLEARAELDLTAPARRAESDGETGAERIWLYSGNLGRAHEWRTLLDAQKLLEERASPWRLVFQGGGPQWPAAQVYAREIGLTCCDFRPYVAETELPAALLAADVLAVTQKPETCGLLWPSKLALVASLPRRVLWVGPVDRAIARDVRGMTGSGVFAPGDAEGVAGWVEGGAADGFEVRDPVAVREAALREWVEVIAGDS